jgi:hypothetical protein
MIAKPLRSSARLSAFRSRQNWLTELNAYAAVIADKRGSASNDTLIGSDSNLIGDSNASGSSGGHNTFVFVHDEG